MQKKCPGIEEVAPSAVAISPAGGLEDRPLPVGVA